MTATRLVSRNPFSLTRRQYKRNIGQPNDSSKVGKAKPRASGGRKTAGLSKDPSQFRMKDSRVAASGCVKAIAANSAFFVSFVRREVGLSLTIRTEWLSVATRSSQYEEDANARDH